MDNATAVARATAVLNTAMTHKMYPEGGIPESDADKLTEAERIIVMARQAKDVAEQVGPAKVPMYKGLCEILFEADVDGVANGAAPATPTPQQPVQEQQPSQPQTSQPGSSPPQAPAASSTPAPSGSESATAPASQPAPAASPASPSPPTSSPEQPAPTPAAPEPIPDNEPKVLEVWSSVGAGQWLVLADKGPQLEVQSLATGEKTLLPGGFLQTKVTEGFVRVKADPDKNTLFREHPGCKTWSAPLDGLDLPAIGSQVQCPQCSLVLPIHDVQANGYAPDPPAPPSAPEQPTSPSEAEAVASTVTGEVVDHDEGDPEYASLLERIDTLYTPLGMPVPHDLASPPTEVPDDLTANPAENRKLHSQFNALAARARYLYSIQAAKARDCGRLRKQYMHSAMKNARQELGKDATVTEVVALAEQHPEIAKWIRRQNHHQDQADAYKVFMEMYYENVSVLSRDLTWASAEERGS